MKFIFLLLLSFIHFLTYAQAKKDSLTVVFVTGDDEYHSREVMEPYAKKLHDEYGFRIIYIKDEAPDADLAPNHDPQPSDLVQAEKIKEADLMVVYMRFRSWKPKSLKLFLDYFESGKPAVGIRTTTHAFWRDRTFSPKYFGGHYKTHNTDHLVGQVNPSYDGHPILRGVDKKFYRSGTGPYVSTPMTEGAEPLLLSYGHDRADSTTGDDSFDSPTYPIAWTFNYKGGRRAMITLGSDETHDHTWDVMLNLFYNSVFWSLRYEVPKDGVLAAGKNLKKIKEKQPFKAAKEIIPAPPIFTPGKGWEVLFDGKDLSKWKHWDISIPPYGIPLDDRAYSTGPIDYTQSPARWKIENGAAIARVGYGDIITRADYTDYMLRLDFYVPRLPDWATGEWRGNSGVFLNGSYEVAILDSYGQQATSRSNGALYRMRAPDEEASKPAGEWQTLEVSVIKGRADVTLNGKMIHKNVALSTPTFNGFPAAMIFPEDSWQKKKGIVMEGPIRLQSENSAVRFANIAVRSLRR